MNKKILITGGSGQVGKCLKPLFPDAVFISSKDYDLTRESNIIKLFEDVHPDVIIHCASKVGGILDNINKPAEYFTENILMNTLLLKYAHKYGVERFVGILSSCIYPDTSDIYPLSETMLHQGPPTKTNFSYGIAKRAMATQIESYNQQYGTKYQYITPSNLYSEHDKFGDNAHFVADLIKKIHEAKINDRQFITLFGTGRPLRQFLYAHDLASIIKEVVDKNVFESFNFSSEENISIYDIANHALKAADAEHIKIAFDSTKPDGQFRKDVSIKKFRALFPDFKITPLEIGLKTTYKKLYENE